MILLRFKKEERLKPIKKGIFHLRPTVAYRDDPVKYRGDPMEGKIFGNPAASFKINGFEISQWIESIIWSREFEGNILSMSFFQLNMDNCHEVEKGIYTINDDAVEKMKGFGDFFITLNSAHIIPSMEAALSGYKCNYEYHPVRYCDIHNYNAVQQCLKNMRDNGYMYSEFFLKDKSEYGPQNEWRFLIHDYANEFPLLDNGGVDLQTDFRSDVPLFKTEQLTTLRISKDLLH